MNKEAAKSIIDTVSSMGKQIDDLYSAIDQIDDEEWKKKLSDAVGFLMRDLSFNFIFPLSDIYPDLDPDK